MHGQYEAYWEWSVFWRSDQLQSCTAEGGQDTADSVATAWRVFFDTLPAAAHILDLATGNGVLAAQAADVSRSSAKRFVVHGVDAADIDPARFVPSVASKLNEVEFHPQTRLEHLPFMDREFDAVVSQYGIEYSDRSRSLAESIRVLKPGGQYRFLVHAADSVLARRCALQHRQAKTMLDSGLFPALERMLRHILVAENGNVSAEMAAAQQSIGEVGTLVAKLDRGFAADEDRSLVDRVLAAVRGLPELRKHNDPGTLLDMADNVRSLLDAQSRRLNAMQQAALSEQQAQDMLAELHDLTGSDVQIEPATSGESGHRVGFWIAGEKRTQAGSATT